MGELGLGDVAIGLALRQQFAVAAALYDPAAIDDADLVGLCDRRQTVGDHDGRTACVKRLLDRLLGFRIESRGRLVEQDDRRVLEEGAGDGDALALSAGAACRARRRAHRSLARSP
jgi:hypothetical protein